MNTTSVQMIRTLSSMRSFHYVSDFIYCEIPSLAKVCMKQKGNGTFHGGSSTLHPYRIVFYLFYTRFENYSAITAITPSPYHLFRWFVKIGQSKQVTGSITLSTLQSVLDACEMNVFERRFALPPTFSKKSKQHHGQQKAVTQCCGY